VGLWSGRVQACLGAALVYLALVSLGIFLRLEADRWGLILSQSVSAGLRDALILHCLGIMVVAAALFVARKRKIDRPAAARVALASLPVLIVVSLDRLAAAAYPPKPIELNRYIAHPTRMWTNRPGWVEKHDHVDLRINSKGLRGVEVPYEKPPGERRIMFLGDSVAFGYRINEEECFVWRIPHLAKTRVGVVNASVQGYSPWQEYDLLESEGLKYDPDIIVHVFCVNDVLDKYLLVPFGGQSVGHRPRQSSALDGSGLYRMFEAIAARHLWNSIELARQREVYSFRRLGKEPDSPLVRQAWNTTLENMDKIVSLAREHGVHFAIVCFPHSDQLMTTDPNMTVVQERMSAYAADAGVPFFDLLPVYRSVREERNLRLDELFVDPLHPTPLGHEIAAQHIYRFLADLDWIE